MKRLLLTAGALLALCMFPAGPAAADSDSYEGVSFHPFTMDPSNEGCVPGSHTYFGYQFRDCDPVNLLFEDLSLSQVVAGLKTQGWTAFGFGSFQFLHLRIGFFPLLQSATLFLTVPGGSEGCPVDVASCRYHVRLWWAGRSVIGAVHFETAGIFRTHDLLNSWEFAESRVCADLDALASMVCSPNLAPLATQASMQGGGTWRGLVNDTRASVIGSQ